MKLNKLILIVDAVERISNITETNDIPAVIDALIGLAWDDEEASDIKQYCANDEETWW